MEDISNKISLKNELLRKSIHLSSSVIPVSYYFLSREIEIIMLSVLSLILIIIDVARIKNVSFQNIYLKFLKPILRNHELENEKNLFTGGTYIVIAYLACVIFFPKAISITSMFIVIFPDSLAAIVGKVYGKHFIGNKTIEGSSAFFITGIIVVMLSPKVTDSISEYYIAFVCVLLTTFFELLTLKIDDNISIPLFFGCAYLILLKLLIG